MRMDRFDPRTLLAVMGYALSMGFLFALTLM